MHKIQTYVKHHSNTIKARYKNKKQFKAGEETLYRKKLF